MRRERNGRDDGHRPEDSPVAWFVVLEQARRTNDFERAAQALRELKRLGVLVRFPRMQEGGSHD